MSYSKVIAAAEKISGDRNRAIFWYENERLAPFSGKTPMELVAEKRVEDLLRYIASLDAGLTG